MESLSCRRREMNCASIAAARNAPALARPEAAKWAF
jgi:hypothetical protein